MINSIFILLNTFLLLAAGGAYLPMLAIGGEKPVVAVNYFDNTSRNNQFNSLSKGIADMLITDLSRSGQVSIVEREKLEDLMQEIELGKSGYVDRKTAQKLGKGLGAESILTGSFLVLNEQLRIDARLVDVESGEVKLAESVSGKTSNFFNLHEQLVAMILRTLNVKSASENSLMRGGDQSVEFETVMEYSKAIDYMDHGMVSDANKLLQNTLKKNPKFLFASDKIEKLKSWMEKVERERNARIEAEIESIITNIDTTNPQMGQQLNQVWTNLITSYEYEKILKVNEKFRRSGLRKNFKLFGEYSSITFGEMSLYYDALGAYTLKRYDDLLICGQNFLTDYPTSMYYSSIKMYMDESIKKLEDLESSKKTIKSQLKIEEIKSFLDFIDGISSRYYLRFLDDSMYVNLQQLYKSLILEKAEESKELFLNKIEMSDLWEFREIAFYMSDTLMMEEIKIFIVKLTENSDFEEKGWDMEDWHKRKIGEIRKRNLTVSKAQEAFSQSKENDIVRFVRSSGDLEKARSWKLLKNLSEWVLVNADSEDSYYVRNLEKAWDHIFSISFQTGGEKEYKQVLKKFENDKVLIDKNGDNHISMVRQKKKDLSDLKKQHEALNQKDANYNIRKSWSNVYRENNMYPEEAAELSGLLKDFVLSNQEKEYLTYMLMTAYSNAGYFSEARIAGKNLIEAFPEGSYAESVKTYIRYLPK